MDARDLKQEVRRAASGDEASAAWLFDTYYPRVYRYALAKLRRPADAEDVAAETFARVLRDLGRFTWRGGGFEAWLFRIAANAVVDVVRRSGREEPTGQPQDDDEVVSSDDPATVVLEGEQGRELEAMMLSLPHDQREVLVLRFTAGLDTAEIGAVMGRNQNTIRQLQFRALENLRRRMKVEVASS